MINLQQQTPEWFEWRKNKIGASDASAILGINPWKNAYQLWEEKIGIKDPSPITQQMKRGIDLEPVARSYFESVTGMKVSPTVVVHPKYEWMIASLDGYSDSGKAVEIKCNGEKNHALALDGKIPDYYYSQVQHQMAVLDCKEIFYFSFDGEKGIGFEIERDDKFIESLIEKEKEFYECMINLSPPAQKYATINDPEGISIAQRLKEIIFQIENLEELKEDLKSKLIDQLNIKYGGQNLIGCGIRLCKKFRKGAINYKTVPELIGVDLEKHRSKPMEYWEIRKEK